MKAPIRTYDLCKNTARQQKYKFTHVFVKEEKDFQAVKCKLLFPSVFLTFFLPSFGRQAPIQKQREME